MEINIFQLLTMCITTLIVEGVILVLFGFEIKTNYKIFLLTNILFQVCLTAFFGSSYIMNYNLVFGTTLLKVGIYMGGLKGQTEKRRKLYAVIAHWASWIIVCFIFSNIWK